MAGMRRDVAGLRWREVKLGSGQIAVRSHRASVNYRMVINDPKTVRSGVVIAIDDDLLAALRRHQADQKEGRLAWAQPGPTPATFFVREMASRTTLRPSSGCFAD
jgi:hypothetical protein